MKIIGISAYYHDAAACLVIDGEIIAAAQEERFTRKKHDSSFPNNAITYCLSEAKITSKDIDHVVFYDKPFLKFERLLETYLAFAPKGFKSFAEKTVLHFNDNITGIVGPNGCGKSNIIDAVRWVLGESRASELRGESMQDVIFNGSTSRQPVGQATIELIFDNHDRTLAGAFASYNEVSIRRKVTREGQSTYYLNGQKCRRRDVTDLFLGTGLGPRSYSIIEQGMISRLIESRPEELRVYIEEAAGISRYKERRRDTSNRISRSRENLERLEDIREELGRQLETLKRQAAAAQQYTQLKQDERQHKSQLATLQWRELRQKLLDQRIGMGRIQDEIVLQTSEQDTRSAQIGRASCRERVCQYV